MVKARQQEMPMPTIVSTATRNMEPAMKNLISRFVKDESGATAIEYGLIASGIAVAIIVAVNLVGTNLNLVWANISGKLLTASQN